MNGNLKAIVLGALMFVATLFVIAIFAALSGCTTTPTLTTKVETVEVPVPFVDKCISAADVPPVPLSRMPKAGTVDQLAAGASLDVRALSAYAATADALLRMCSQP